MQAAFIRTFQSYCTGFSAESMENSPRYIRIIEIFFCMIQSPIQIPGDKVNISAVQSGASACKDQSIRSAITAEVFFQPVTKIEYLLAAFFFTESVQRITKKTCHSPIGMQIIHIVIFTFQIPADNGITACGSGNDVHPPVSIRIFISLHLISHIAFQTCMGINGQIHSIFSQFFRQFSKKDMGFFPRFIQKVKFLYISHIGNLSQYLICQGREHPPYLSPVLADQRHQLFTVCRHAEALFACSFYPDLHILSGYFPPVKPKACIIGWLASYGNCPVFQDFFRYMFLKIHQFKQFDPVTFRSEDQFVLFTVESHFKTYVVKSQIQYLPALCYQLMAASVVFILIHDPAQL